MRQKKHVYLVSICKNKSCITPCRVPAGPQLCSRDTGFERSVSSTKSTAAAGFWTDVEKDLQTWPMGPNLVVEVALVEGTEAGAAAGPGACRRCRSRTLAQEHRRVDEAALHVLRRVTCWHAGEHGPVSGSARGTHGRGGRGVRLRGRSCALAAGCRSPLPHRGPWKLRMAMLRRRSRGL